MPSLTLLGQSVVSGLLAGGLYALLALGLSLSWGLLRLVNLSHFALALLGAYLTYQLGHAFHLAPWLAAGLIVPAFFALGVVLHVVFARFRVTEFTSLLVTLDRKSTRLNSSHSQISYAVFCLKKKTEHDTARHPAPT